MAGEGVHVPDPALAEARAVDRSAQLAAEHGMLQFFSYAHLPPHLMEVSMPFCDLAEDLVVRLPRNPERTVALRNLLAAKDAAVRAKLFTSE
jgi:hypothetical protein